MVMLKVSLHWVTVNSDDVRFTFSDVSGGTLPPGLAASDHELVETIATND